MKILNHLTIKNLKMNKKRTIVTIIGIILSTSLMVGIGLLFSSFHDYLVQEVSSSEGSYHALYSEISQSDLNIISKENLDYYYYKSLGFSKIDSKNEYKPYIFLAAVNNNYFKELKLISGRFPQNSSEIIISNHLFYNGGVTYNIGDEVTLKYGYRKIEDLNTYQNIAYAEGEELVEENTKTYKVVGIIERSNYEDYSAAGYTVYTLDESTEGMANVYVTFSKPKKIMAKAKDLAEKINYNENKIKYNSRLLAFYGESGYSNVNIAMISMLGIMLSLVSIGCIIVIYNSFAISVMERKKQFGLLSSIGASKKELSYMIFFEALVVGVIGVILGILGSYIGIGTVIAILNNLLNKILEFKLRLISTPIFIIIPIIFIFLCIFISAIIPSVRASRVSPIEAIRQNDDIKIDKRKIKTGKVVKSLFGIEGDIALKNIKRNKKKYRVTTISLFISIVLFISFSSYMQYTLSAADNIVTSYNYDITVRGYRQNDEKAEEIVNRLLTSPSIKKYTKYFYYYIPIKRTVHFTDGYIKYAKNSYGESYKEIFEDSSYDNIDVIVLDDNSYNNYKKDLGLSEDKIILLNKYKGVTYNDGSRVNYDVNVIKDKKVVLNLCDFSSVEDEEKMPSDISKYCQKNLNNIFITDKSYPLISEIEYDESYKLIMNERIFDIVVGEELNSYTVNIVSDNTKELDKIGEELNKQTSAYYYNIKEEMQMENNIVIAVKLLMYGFISLVTLIGVTSVFNTISTSMSLRKREFAVLRSIGLNKHGFNKILFFESLFFGLKSLIYALPVSFIIIILIHLSLSNAVSMSNILIPWNSIIISIVMVFIIILITMLYSASKIKKHNIIDEIREENI